VVILSCSILSCQKLLQSLPLQRLRRSTLFADVLSVKVFPKSPPAAGKLPTDRLSSCTYAPSGVPKHLVQRLRRSTLFADVLSSKNLLPNSALRTPHSALLTPNSEPLFFFVTFFLCKHCGPCPHPLQVLPPGIDIVCTKSHGVHAGV